MAINGGQTSAVPCAARPVKRTATAAGVRSCGASSTSRICSAISSSATESPKLMSITAVPGPCPAIWRPCSARVRPLTSFRSTSYRSSAPTCGAVLPERQIVRPQWACRGGCESVQQPLMQLPHVARVGVALKAIQDFPAQRRPCCRLSTRFGDRTRVSYSYFLAIYSSITFARFQQGVDREE